MKIADYLLLFFQGSQLGLLSRGLLINAHLSSVFPVAL